MFMTVVNRGRFDVKSGTRKGRTTSGPSRPVCSSATIEFLYPTRQHARRRRPLS
jgi:hypothetical protein